MSIPVRLFYLNFNKNGQKRRGSGERNFCPPAEARGEGEAEHTIWLREQDSFRTFDWEKAIPDPVIVINQARQLLVLV